MVVAVHTAARQLLVLRRPCLPAATDHTGLPRTALGSPAPPGGGLPWSGTETREPAAGLLLGRLALLLALTAGLPVGCDGLVLATSRTGSKRGRTIGGAGVTDGDMLSMALHLRDQGMSPRDIAKRLVITTGAKKGQHPSPPPSCACCASTTSRPPPR